MKCKIKLATLNDIITFFPFFQTSLKTQFPHYSPKTINFFLAKDYSLEKNKQGIKENWRQIYLALNNEQIVGYLMATKPYGGVSFCNWIAVDPQHQGQGVASKLLKTWECQAKIDSAHKLHLWTDIRNLDFYKNRGFILVGEIPQNYFGSDDFLFYKIINDPKDCYLNSQH